MREKIINHLILKSSIEKIKSKSLLLGKTNLDFAYAFLYYRFLFCLIIFSVCCLVNIRGMIIAPFTVIIFYYTSEYLIFDLEIINRRNVLEKDTLFFLEILTTSLWNTPNLLKALKLTCNTLNNSITKEINITLQEMELGYSYQEAVNRLKMRIPSELIRTVILKLMKSTNDNNPGLLADQINYMRSEYLLNRQKEIKHLPVRLLIVSLIFYIPMLLMIIFVPALT